MSKHIIIINLTKYELKLIAGKRGIKKKFSRKKLLKAISKSDRNFKNISLIGLKRIAKMQNLSQNKLEQIKKMKNLPQNELEEIAKMRHIKNYKDMAKEELLIALLKPKQSHAELYKS